MKLIKFPSSLSNLSFEELMKRSNELISSGKVNQEIYNLYTEEFKRRLEQEIANLKRTISEIN